MATEIITPEQKKQTEDLEKDCEKAQEQAIKQQLEDARKKAEALIKNQFQELAQEPTKIMAEIEKAKDKLGEIINGYKNPNTEEFDPNAIIKELEAMLNPVVDGLTKLPVPPIPGLAQVSGLLATLDKMSKKISKQSDEDIKKRVPKKPELSSKFMDIMSELYDQIRTLMSNIYGVLIELIFKMFEAIIGMFMQIAGVIGVPGIPFPLNLVPTCIELMPDIKKLVNNATSKLSTAAKGILKDKMREIQSLQIPEIPDSISIPLPVSTCPAHTGNDDDKENTKTDENKTDTASSNQK